ncbi:hypothetical protein FXO38_34003 [Capsicum annuum]|nr:hypothetical protein FXO38_34003 [Capsicum annuum]KAF3627881.1 hypothetical protein FXO37_29639 [Capsicum annuum]
MLQLVWCHTYSQLAYLLAFSMYLIWIAYSSRLSLVLSVTAGVSSAIQMLRSANSAFNSAEATPELSEANMVVFLGDLNYRLDGISYDEARDFISQRRFDWLRERDQLHTDIDVGNVFQGMREAVMRFSPTYKFERHQIGLAGYDSGEKKQIPAWCDKILYRDSRSTSAFTCSLDCPVVSSVLRYRYQSWVSLWSFGVLSIVWHFEYQIWGVINLVSKTKSEVGKYREKERKRENKIARTISFKFYQPKSEGGNQSQFCPKSSVPNPPPVSVPAAKLRNGNSDRVPGSKSQGSISFARTNPLCQTYVKDSSFETPSLEPVPIESEYSDAFPEDLPEVSPEKEIDFSLDLLSDS